MATTLGSALMNKEPFGEGPLTEGPFLDPKRKWQYPLNDGAMLHTPGVEVFRGNRGTGYKYLETPYEIGVISAAMPRGNRDEGLYLYDPETMEYLPQYVEVVKARIRGVLRLAAIKGYNAIVGGA